MPPHQTFSDSWLSAAIARIEADYHDAHWVQEKVGDCALAHQHIGQLMRPAAMSH